MKFDMNLLVSCIGEHRFTLRRMMDSPVLECWEEVWFLNGPAFQCWKKVWFLNGLVLEWRQLTVPQVQFLDVTFLTGLKSWCSNVPDHPCTLEI